MTKKISKILFILLVFTFFTSTLISQNVNRRTDGTVTQLKWSEDGKIFTYGNKGILYEYNLSNNNVKEIGVADAAPENPFARRQQEQVTTGGRKIDRPARGHQYATVKSPVANIYSVCKDYNVWIENDDTGEKIQITTDGHKKFRYGTANWTYGEELGVIHGMWWTPDGKKLIYYVFSEEFVKEFYLTFKNTEAYTTVWSEGYIKAGEPNPIVWFEVYDLETKKKTPIHVGEDKRPDQYIYNQFFAPGGEFIFSRTDRLQRELDVMTVDLNTGITRVIVSEKQDKFQDNKPTMRFLNDNKRFIWKSEKTKWAHFELRHIDGRLLNPLTKGEFPCLNVTSVDEKNGYLYFTATSNQTRGNHLNTHLHRVKLNGKNQEQLTKKELNHTLINMSPDNNYFIARYESVNVPPSTELFSANGKSIKVLAQGPEGSNRSELFTFIANDGVTVLYGILNKPEDFDPNKKYPMILSLYGGPDGTDVNNRYTEGDNSYNSKGYLTCKFSYRGGSGRGKLFLDMGYGKLGDVDIQDQSDGCRFLAERDYIDPSKIGVIGHSYGGYMAAMGAVKHSDIFAAAVDRAGPTHWKHYDSIYTERYMNTPQNNPEGYENGSVFPFIKNMKTKLLIQHGLEDDNVHPTNAWHFIDELNKAKKYYELHIFPYGTHGFAGQERVLDFFDRHLKNKKVEIDL